MNNISPLNQTPLDEAAVQYFKSNPSPENKTILVEKAKGLVHHFARLYGGGYHMDDLVQSGMEGLLKALNNYHPNKSVSFTTYASHCVIGEIRHYVRKESSYYKPGSIAGMQNKVNRVIDDCLKSNGTIPTTAEIAETLGVREYTVTTVMSAGIIDFAEVETENIKTTRYESGKLPIEDRLFLEHAFMKLNVIQKKVIYMLFFYDLTQTEVAKKLGLSQRQVSRIKEGSLKSMRKA